MPIRIQPGLRPALLAGLGASVVLAACGSLGPGAAPAATSHKPASHPVAAEPVHIWAGAHQPPAGFDWNPVPGSAYLAVTTVDGGQVSMLWMDPSHLKFRYVPGNQFPEASPITKADVTPSTWVPNMVAAFSGGFKLADHVGGYYYAGRMVSPLLPGLATIVAYRDGTLQVGVWGRGQKLTPQMLMVRQNLPPLVDQGVIQTKPTDVPHTWGFTFNLRWKVNRSALGQRPDGTLVFAYGHLIKPVTLASYIAATGVTTAIDLDMNGYWPAAFTYRHVGTKTIGARLNPYVVHTPSLYFNQYHKDFFAVEAFPAVIS